MKIQGNLATALKAPFSLTTRAKNSTVQVSKCGQAETFEGRKIFVIAALRSLRNGNWKADFQIFSPSCQHGNLIPNKPEIR